MNRCHRLVYGGLLVLGLAPAAALAQTSDIVHQTNGRQIRGEITAIGPTHVSIQVRDAVQQVAVNEIRRISFAQEPTLLRRARDLIHEGQLQDALVALNQIDRKSVDRPAILTDIQYYTVYCQVKMALSTGDDLASVGVAMRAFDNDNPDSYHHFEAVEILGDLAMALGKYGGAVLFYSQMGKAPWPELQMRGALLEARALRGDNKWAEALAKYDAVLANQLSTPEANRQKDLARVGRAACQSQLGQASEAIAAIDEVIQKSDPKDIALLAEAYNALGACHRQLKQTQDALWAYLHVELLFAQSPEAHAEALHYLVGLWNEMKKPERAVAARNVLKSRYPASRWANDL